MQVFQPDTAAKRVELLHGAVPQLSRIGLLFVLPGDPRDMRLPDATRREAETAARAFGVELQVLGMPESPDAFSEAFAALTRAQVSAVMVHANPFLLLHRATIAALALEHRLPTIMEDRRYAQAGGLMSYGPNVLDIFRRVATYVDKILKGANPAFARGAADRLRASHQSQDGRAARSHDPANAPLPGHRGDPVSIEEPYEKTTLFCDSSLLHTTTRSDFIEGLGLLTAARVRYIRFPFHGACER